MKKTEIDNLSKDAYEARKAGISYGKWKAEHPHTKQIKREILPFEIVCENCGKHFFSVTRNRKFCSYDCNQEAHIKKITEKRRKNKV